MKSLYPEIKPYQTFFLATESVHTIYVELSGNADGQPVVFLHGGPCSGTRPYHRRFFNPDKYLIILFDQRGCGQSLPFGELANNTTQDLINDMERIRKHLELTKWLLFAGSWGGTLALLYAQQHRAQVSAMIIRGVFLARQQDLDWFIKLGVNLIYPEQWQQLLQALSLASNDQVIDGFCQALWSDDRQRQVSAAKAWDAWGTQVAIGSEYQQTDQELNAERADKLVLQARMELHYARARYFIVDNQVLAGCHELNEIPTTIIHGRYDLVCPMEAAYQLHQVLVNAEFKVLDQAGHIASGAQMIDALVAATDRIVG